MRRSRAALTALRPALQLPTAAIGKRQPESQGATGCGVQAVSANLRQLPMGPGLHLHQWLIAARSHRLENWLGTNAAIFGPPPVSECRPVAHAQAEKPGTWKAQPHRWAGIAHAGLWPIVSLCAIRAEDRDQAPFSGTQRAEVEVFASWLCLPLRGLLWRGHRATRYQSERGASDEREHLSGHRPTSRNPHPAAPATPRSARAGP